MLRVVLFTAMSNLVQLSYTTADWPSCYDMNIFSPVVLTLKFNLDLSKVKSEVKFGTDGEHL